MEKEKRKNTEPTLTRNERFALIALLGVANLIVVIWGAARGVSDDVGGPLIVGDAFLLLTISWLSYRSIVSLILIALVTFGMAVFLANVLGYTDDLEGGFAVGFALLICGQALNYFLSTPPNEGDEEYWEDVSDEEKVAT